MSRDTPGLGWRNKVGLGDPVKLRTGLVLALILVLGATGYFLVRSAEDRVTANMLSRVARFAIPLNLQVEDETVG